MNPVPAARRGVTLVELMIAIVILAVAIVASIGVMFGTGVQNETQKNQALATKACQEIIDTLLSLNFDSMTNPGTFTGNGGGQPDAVTTAPYSASHFKGFFLAKPPLANNQWIGEFEIRNASNDMLNAFQSANVRSQLEPPFDSGTLASNNWQVAEITVRLSLRNIQVLIRTLRRR